MPSHGVAFENRTLGDWAPFHASMEDVYGAIAQYYDLSALSFRTALYRPAGAHGSASFGVGLKTHLAATGKSSASASFVLLI